MSAAKKKKSKKLLQFLKIRNDVKDSETINFDASDVNVSNDALFDVKPTEKKEFHPNDSIPHDTELTNSENDSTQNPTGSNLNRWSLFSKTPFRQQIQLNYVEPDDLPRGHAIDVKKADNSLGRRISFKQNSPPPETYADCLNDIESKGIEVNLKSGRKPKNGSSGEAKFLRECKSSFARHDTSKLNSISNSELSSAQRDYAFSPRQDELPVGGEGVIENSVLLESTSRLKDTSLKKTTTLHMPSINNRGAYGLIFEDRDEHRIMC